MPEKQSIESTSPQQFTDFYEAAEAEQSAEVTEELTETPAEEGAEEEPIESPEENTVEEESEESPAEVTAEDREVLGWVKENATQLHQLVKFDMALKEPGFEEQIKLVLDGAAQMHETTPEAILAKLGFSSAASEEKVEAEEGEEMEPWEKDYIERAKSAASKEFAKQIQPLQLELQRLKEAEQNRIEELSLKTRVEQSYAGLASRIEKETGFKPTKAQVEKAIRTHPSLEQAEAIKLTYMSEILKTATKHVAKTSQKAPTIPARSSDSGSLKNTKKGFTDYLADIEAQS